MPATNSSISPVAAFDVGGAARYISMSERAVWKLLRDGTLQRIRLGKRTLVARADLDRLLKKLAKAA